MSALKFTSVEDTPEMVQAKLSNKLAIDVGHKIKVAVKSLQTHQCYILVLYKQRAVLISVDDQ